MKFNLNSKKLLLSLGISSSIVLIACGGGGDETSSLGVNGQGASTSTTVPSNPTNPISKGSLLTTTGITLCGNNDVNGLPCNSLSTIWLGLLQDGEVKAGQKMSYTTLNQNGAECVRDNVTGLIWEQKTDDGGLRDKDNYYSWYNTDNTNNGGNVGKANGGSCIGSACDTQDYIAKLNARNYCGYDNWRLPTLDELRSIVDYSRHHPAINPIFTNTKESYYWSSSTYARDVNEALSITFNYGYDTGNGKIYGYYIRAVR